MKGIFNLKTAAALLLAAGVTGCSSSQMTASSQPTMSVNNFVFAYGKGYKSGMSPTYHIKYWAKNSIGKNIATGANSLPAMHNATSFAVSMAQPSMRMIGFEVMAKGANGMALGTCNAFYKVGGKIHTHVRPHTMHGSFNCKNITVMAEPNDTYQFTFPAMMTK